MSEPTHVETPKLNLAFAPIGDAGEELSHARTPEVTQDEAKATAAALSRLTGAPKEVRTRKPRRTKPKSTPAEVEKPEWRRRPGRPRSLRKHPLTLKTTEKHLRFLYALTDEGGLLVEGIEDGLNQLAIKVLQEASWRGRELSPELIEAAQMLSNKARN